MTNLAPVAQTFDRANVAPFPKSPVAPPARAHFRMRHWALCVSFVICVGLPTLVSGFYLFLVALDQYVSRAGFTVRSEEVGGSQEFLGSLVRLSDASSSDSDVLYHFIRSRQIVDIINEKIDLRNIWGLSDQDPAYGFRPRDPVEELVEYWRDMVRVIYDPRNGIMRLEVRAFQPEDAQRIAQEILEQSAHKINQLSSIAREDTTRHAEEELLQAVSRLKEARQALTRFRTENQIIDPSADVQEQTGLLFTLQERLADSLIRLDLLRETARASDPRIEHTMREVRAIRSRVEEERQKLGVSSGVDREDPATLVGRYDSLSVDLEFAEGAYFSALATYDTAVAEARRKSRYLATYLPATRAESSEFPNRGQTLALIGLSLSGIWLVGVLIAYSLKDRR